MDKLNNFNSDKAIYSNQSSYSTSQLLPISKPNLLSTIAKADSGASNHYFQQNDMKYILNPVQDETGIQVALPNSKTIKATHQGYLQLSDALTNQAQHTTIFKHLNNNLLSIGQLCDDNCIVIFTKNKVNVYKDNTLILQGYRSLSGDGLWNVPIYQPNPATNIQSKVNSTQIQPCPSLNVIIRKNTTARDLVLYLHAACFSPTKYTFLKAVKKHHFLGWPGLTPSLITKH